MVVTEKQKVFSEVNAFLEIVGEEYKNKIPKELIKLINEEKSEEYNPKYDSEIPIEEQNLSRETLAMIALLDLNYWCETEEEKQSLRKIFSQNEKTYQQEIREKYNPDEIFKNKAKQEEGINDSSENTSMIEYNRTNFIQKIINILKNIFKKNI